MTTSFITQDKDGKVLKTRIEALKDIVDMCCDRKIPTKRKYGTWTVPKEQENTMREGNNVMVLNKYIKNVSIRWDKDIKPLRFIS